MARNKLTSLFSTKDSRSFCQDIEDIKNNYENQRFRWERVWHENNFFDDGFHYRIISPDTRQVLDEAGVGSLYNPRRAIPKASRQGRGIINLLLANRPVPVVYPKKIIKANYSDVNRMESAQESARIIAQRTGQFILDIWKEQKLLSEKLPYAMLMAFRHSVSYLKVWPDMETKKIRVSVRDAFDVYVSGEFPDIQDEPIVIESYSEQVEWVKNNPLFDKKVRDKVVPDNKYSSSRVKNSYMESRFGVKRENKMTDTVTIYETYIKEYLTEDLIGKIKKQEDSDIVLRGRNIGDVVIKQTVSCSGANETLYETYTTLSKYPYVPVQFEPGPLYSTPLLDRFKPMNKSLDNTISRFEKMVMTNAAGRYWTRDAEKPIITNDASGEWITSPTKPEVLPNPEMSATALQYVTLLTSYIEEQGVTTAALGRLPGNVQSGVAIESLKSSEYASLSVALECLKATVGQVAERIFDIVDDYYITPQTVYFLNEGTPDYFQIIGARGAQIYKDLKQDQMLDGMIVVSKDTVVDIEIESGLGYTTEGRRDNAQRIIESLRAYVAEGYIPPEIVKSVIIEYLKTFQFGNLVEITKAFDEFSQKQESPEDDISKMKIAVAETLKDLGMVGADAENTQIQAAKLGTAEALNDVTSL